MTDSRQSSRPGPVHGGDGMTRVFRRHLAALLGLLVYLPAAGVAQLYGDYNPEDFRREYPANVHFGFVKNEDGEYIEGATVVLASKQLDFVAVTDARGRFRMNLPVEIHPDRVTPGCSHPDYRTASIITRPPRGDATSPSEINCFLR